MVSVLTLLAALAATEGWLRVTGYRDRLAARTVDDGVRRWRALMAAGILRADDDPVRRYALRANTVGSVDDMTFRISSQGVRGPDLATPKPAREKRLLCLGDSFTFGLWCEEDETLVARLADMATAAERTAGSDVVWRPINLGVPGYHTGQERVAFEETGLALEPDAVVIYFTTNDIQQYGFFFDEKYGLRTDNLPLPVWFKRAAWHSHLYGFLAHRHFTRLSSVPSAYLNPDGPWSHVRPANQAFTRNALAAIVAECRARDLPVFLINQPEPMWTRATRDPAWEFLPVVRWVDDVARDLEVPTLNLLGWIRGYADNIDRVASSPPGEAPPPDFLLEEYYADTRCQEIVAFAKQTATAAGQAWEALPARHRLALLLAHPDGIPETIDFHFTAAGYAHLAALVYPALRDAGVLP